LPRNKSVAVATSLSRVSLISRYPKFTAIGAGRYPIAPMRTSEAVLG
jgi:hypothetical protein